MKINIKIIDSGCSKCFRTIENVNSACSRLRVDADIHTISSMDEMIDYGIVTAPALIINEKVKLIGRVPEVEDVISWIREDLPQD